MRADCSMNRFARMLVTCLASVTWAGLALAQTAPPATQTGVPPTTQGPGRGGFVPAPVVIGPSAPVPPQVAIPRPTAAELVQVNALVKKFIHGESSSNKALLKKFEPLLTARPAAHQARQSAQHPTPPNVVLIISDDLGYGDIGSYGAKDIRTPHLDRLARQGIRFINAYANGAVCTPTRTALMTGRYQQRVGLEQVLSLSEDDLKRGLSANGNTLPALLQANGYATALYGKWHLGFRPEFQPNAHGFQDFFGFLGGAVNYYTHRGRDGKPDLFENGSPIESKDYLTDAITRRGVAFIERSAEKPFFLELAYNAPHWPFLPPDLPPSLAHSELRSLSQQATDPYPPTRRDYARMVERLDAGIGQVLAALEKAGLSKSTLVIFTNDNGGEWLSRNTPFFHRKGTLWEGGIRVPLIVRWPERLAAGRTSSQVAITMDLTATILRATNTPVSQVHRLDGIDLLPHIGASWQQTERRLFWRKLPFPNGQIAVRDSRWKLLVDGPNAFLFDVDADPGERRDLSATRPDLVRKMVQLYEEWTADVSSRPGSPKAERSP